MPNQLPLLSSTTTNPADVGTFRYFTPWLFILSLIGCVIYWRAFPDPLTLATHNWPLILVGVLGAFIGNITAIGGGIVFIPVLMFAYKIDPVSALKLAFVTQAVGMTSGASGWLRRGEVPLGLLKWTVPPLILGTLVSTFLIHPQPMLVKGLFGPVAFITGLLTLITLDRKGGLTELPAKAFLPTLLVAFIGGMITGWVAIGEGEIIAAFCMLSYGLNANRAIGLGVVLLAINSLLLAAIHAFYFGGVPWDMAAFTMLGVLWGGRLGPFLAQWISLRMTKKVFALIALLDGLVVTCHAGYSLFLK
ncbi:MAG: sulfite exporter TauE/SafE family protein [Methylococcaceae bacterium]|nr:sulfite exporter TauE/SafE family protein [Methylococcaceae bacterium]